ncbi:Fe-S cluster assembly ATPase SufC [Salsipaludibacter albus]|uniref:Fe-S cluster assembly ATPase SufC n=1 Tax=Salsipaludibacter albus TaxID=2849650 RepID=UPI001EE4141E|nr:Fe-S cluster assembly ATPase SufC [Salsipaludibacter albus]MBY5164339.1 Fe-S cluster assembly ATPase SufC [Salsipaludibacter albus]
MAELSIRDLTVRVDGTDILKGVTLDLEKGKTLALMGPNGSGKSTLAYAIAGHPAYEVTGGEILFKGEDITEWTPDERNRAGVFLAMQYPVEVPGVSLTNFLRTAVNARLEEDKPVREFMGELRTAMSDLDVDESFLQRSVNEGFSGGEKKRFEILQMALLRPEVAVLDETDSGLDVDALRIVSEGIDRLRGPDLGVLVITHYTRILRYLTPDEVHVMLGGRIVASGGPELADELEEHGYEHYAVSA